MRAWKDGAPFVDEFPSLVENDDIVGRIVGQQKDVSLAIAGETVAIVDRSFFVENAPARNRFVLKFALS